MTRKLNHPYFHLTIGIASFLLLYFSAIFFSEKTPDFQQFSNALNQKEILAEQSLSDLTQETATTLSFSEAYYELNKSQGVSFFILENSQLLYWTNRSIDFSSNLSEFKKNKGVVKLQNGWYEYLLKKSNKKTYLAFILIKNDYSIKNKYLKNTFHSSFNIDDELEIVFNKEEQTTPIKSVTGDFLFGLKNTSESNHQTNANNWLLLILFFSGFIFTTSFVSKQSRKIISLRKSSPIIVIFFIGIVRLTLLYFQPFESLFQQELFSPAIFAQSVILPSLGDLVINTILFAIIIYYLSRAIQNINAHNKFIVFVIAASIAVSPLILANLLEGLITNSKINFDINYLLDLNAYSFIGIGAITSLFIAIILFVKISINHFSKKAFKKNQLIIIFWLPSLIAVIIGHFNLGFSAFLTLWILLVILVFSMKTDTKRSFYRSVFLVLIISITTSYGFIHLGKLKAEINKEFVAKKLAKERDPVTEYLFEDIAEKIWNDTLIPNTSNSYLENENKVNKHIIDRYFGGHYSKYDINIIGIFNDNDSIYVEENQLVNAAAFFKDKVELETDDPFRVNKTLNFLYSIERGSSYFATISIQPIEENILLYIELLPKVFSKTEGYPELLLNEQDVSNPLNTNTYSYAKYKEGKLINNTGKFNYSIELSNQYRFNNDGFFKTTFDNAYHVIYQNDKNTSIILSSPQKTIFNYITTFSYFFIITSILVLVIGLIFKISPFNWQIALTDFSTKIQLFIIASIFLSFLLFSWGTSYYIKKQYLEKNKTQLAEKVQSVLIELEHKLGAKEILSKDMYDEMTYYLVKFSNVFYTDINLYDKNGKLLATSRPEIFEQGLIGKQMSPEAYDQIHIHKKSNFTHSENIGNLNYISTYVPFRNEKHQILAYMNLPYFAKQNELENELSSFYTALINIYGLLFLISTIIAVFFANYISEPVRMIKNKISALQIGQSYDLLEWESNDEIGALVYEYNKKVIELERNATKLVKSERESAWREMAKQVAHEIKNPLTPMKLSIQQLERVAKDKPDDLNERIERTAKTLVEQIDTLTKIADEFSNFAKMPKAQDSEINLIPIIETTLDLYKEEAVFISITNNGNNEANIIADKDQLSRVFNNLIKNAIQAIPSTIEGKIDVVITEEELNYIVEIKDNGSGISEDKKDKIFVPNFTTKSTGMGLGLAMVKNIIENANGSIWFETKEEIGTSFFIKFPKA
ncbi:MAG: ATP-binding protein [Vicingaceae bacterium]|nr:ATP-binding protein [Vicingaceae bacterium]